MYHIFTDGGARNNGKGVSSWGFVVYDNDQVRLGSKRKGYGTHLGYTNNQMELQAIIEALTWADKSEGMVAIYTDSNYVYQGITEWIKNWIRNNWRTSNKGPVKNAEQWKELHRLSTRLGTRLTFYKVKAHTTGIDFRTQGNRVADQLCNVAMDEVELNEKF